MKGKSKPQCPLDKTDFGPTYKTIDDLGTNHLAIKILEDKDKEKLNQQCQIHYQNLDMICLTDKLLVCGACVLFGDHKGHEVQLLSEIQKIAEGKKAQLQALYDKVDGKMAEFHLSLEENRQDMKKIVKEKFDILRLRIEKEEAKMQSDIDKVFSKEKAIFDELINGSGDLRADIKARLAEFDSVVFNPNITKITEESFGDIERQVDEMVVSITKHSKKSLDFEKLKEKALSSRNLLKDLKIFEPFNEKPMSLSVKELELKIEMSGFMKLDKEGLWNNLGEMMYPLVLELVGERFAPKVTGMLIDLETLQVSEILQFLKDEELLKSKANEALLVLKEFNNIED